MIFWWWHCCPIVFLLHDIIAEKVQMFQVRFLGFFCTLTVVWMFDFLSILAAVESSSSHSPPCLTLSHLRFVLRLARGGFSDKRELPLGSVYKDNNEQIASMKVTISISQMPSCILTPKRQWQHSARTYTSDDCLISKHLTTYLSVLLRVFF